MLDMDEIKSEIARLENGNVTFSTVEKLAMLYIVQERNSPTPEPEPVEMQQMPRYAYAAAPTAPKSDFLEAVGKVPIEKALDVLDEHMEAIKLLYPKEYKAVINKILA
jgi:hypothetical protein